MLNTYLRLKGVAIRFALMDGDEVRAAAAVSSPRGQSGGGGWGMTRLPILCARPGNVGVQIDSYRSIKTMFNRPRCGQFTAHFLGLTYENSSMENYQRVVERTAHRAKILEAKLEKLRAHEQHLVDDELKRRKRRQEREAARQRQLWQQQQSMKRQEQRALEASAAVLIQKCTRGMLGRRYAAVLWRLQMEQAAAKTLQRSVQSYARQCRHRREQQAEREAAATTLQHRARRFLSDRRTASAKALAEAASDEPPVLAQTDSSEVLAVVVDVVSAVSEASSESAPDSLDDRVVIRDVSLDLLFSDDEDGSMSPIQLGGPALLVETQLTPHPPSVKAQTRSTPKRPARVKRVGGGFRHARAASPDTDRAPVATGRSRRHIQHAAVGSAGQQEQPR